MSDSTTDLTCFSHEHLFSQIEGAAMERGHYRVRFYVLNGLLSREPTPEIGDFFYYPSAGTIRDTQMNIVYYSSLIDRYNLKARKERS